MKSDTGKKTIKVTAIVTVGIFFLIAIIPVAFVEAINPFKSNPYLTSDAEKDKREDDVYDKALDEIKQSKNTEELYVNLDMVRIFEYFVVYDAKTELIDVTQEDAKTHLETYYIYQEDKEIKTPKLDDKGEAVVDEETGEALHETKVITVEKAKSLDRIIEDLSKDYPSLLNEAYVLQIINIYDFQKNITKQKIHGGGTGEAVSKGCYVYFSPFGEYLEGGAHWGVDLSGERGTPIMAVHDGVIKEIVNQYDDTPVGLSFDEARAYYGRENYVLIEHDPTIVGASSFQTRYMHMTTWDGMPYKVGDEVKTGEVIGYMGNSGFSTGYHLHFETWINGERIDPLTFFEFGQLRDNSSYTGCGY